MQKSEEKLELQRNISVFTWLVSKWFYFSTKKKLRKKVPPFREEKPSM